jgi:hypothetical protein
MTGLVHNIKRENEMIVTEEIITPERALELHEKNRINFRPIDKSRVTRLAKEIAAGKWEFTGDTIKINPDGLILDGQHRIEACIQSGIPIKTLIAFNVKASALAIDRGKPRTVGQYIANEGIKNANSVASSAKLCLLHDKGLWHVQGVGAGYITDSEIVDYAIKNSESLNNACTIAKRLSLIPSSIAITIIHIGSGRIAYPFANEFVEWFWHGAITGERLNATDPPLVLRNRLIDNANAKAKLSPSFLRFMATYAWNKAVLGEQMKILRFSSVGPKAQKPPEQILVAES